MPTTTPLTRSIDINFLKTSDFDTTPLGGVVHWILTIGKSLVFVTFLVVILGFAYRFHLDKQVETLNDQLTENIQQVQQYSDTEPEMRLLQTKLDLIDSILMQEPNVTTILASLEQNLPKNAQIERLTLENKQSLVLEGLAENEIVFANLLGAFTQYEPYAQIVIDTLESGGVANPQINFVIKIALKQSDS